MIQIARAEETADRAVDLGTNAIVKGRGGPDVARAKRRQELAVVERRTRGRCPRRRTRDEPELRRFAGTARGHAKLEYLDTKAARLGFSEPKAQPSFEDGAGDR